MRILVIGDGGWGTSLAVVLAGKGHAVTLWSNFPDYAGQLRRSRHNVKFLPEIAIPESIEIVSPASGPLEQFDLAVAAVPTQHMRGALRRIADQLAPAPPVVSVAKGIENKTLRRPTEIVAEVLAPASLAALSGPSHAEEVVRGLPATVVVASADEAFAREVQQAVATERFRIYTTTDLPGVELAGALKNVIAIAAGICDGLKLGDNAKAALLTRGLVEMSRLGEALGARRATFAGLAGMGDLITTCFSPFGRNLATGRAIGMGDRLADVLARTEMVAEGVPTTASAIQLARREGIHMPIAEEINRVLFEDKPPLKAVSDLMQRELRPEED